MVRECSLRCSQGDQGIEHCHGTLVVHDDSSVECTDPLCADVVVETHELVLECWQVNGGCECVAVVPVTVVRVTA